MKEKIMNFIREISKNNTATTIIYTISLGVLAIYANKELNVEENKYLNSVLNDTNAKIDGITSNLSLEKKSYAKELWEQYTIIDGKLVDMKEVNNQKLIDDTIKKFDNHISYPYESIIFDSKSIALENNKIKSHKESSFKNDLSIDEIINKIIDNSSKVDKNKAISVFETNNKDIYIKTLNEILNNILNNATNDINEDLYLIQNLKIVYYKDNINLINNVKLNNENIASLSYYTTSFYSKGDNAIIIANDNYSEDDIRECLNHLITHVRQTSLDKNDSLLSYNWAKRNVLFEGPVNTNPESIINKSITSINDDNERKLLLLSMFNKDASKEKYYNALFDEDSISYLKILGIKNDDEYYEFLKVLECMNLYNSQDLAIKYYLHDTNKENINYQELLNFNDILGKNYILWLYQKYVINLLNYQKENNLSLEDNLFMHQIGLNTLVDYGVLSDNKESNIKLYNELTRLNNIYYDFIKEYYNISDYELEKEIDNTTNITHQFNKYYNIIDYSVEIDTMHAKELINKFPMLELIYKQPISTKKLELIKRSSD